MRVVTRHALKGRLLPVVTFLGPAFAGLISGSFIIESIFFYSRTRSFLCHRRIQSRLHHGSWNRTHFMPA